MVLINFEVSPFSVLLTRPILTLKFIALAGVVHLDQHAKLAMQVNFEFLLGMTV